MQIVSIAKPVSTRIKAAYELSMVASFVIRGNTVLRFNNQVLRLVPLVPLEDGRGLKDSGLLLGQHALRVRQERTTPNQHRARIHA